MRRLNLASVWAAFALFFLCVGAHNAGASLPSTASPPPKGGDARTSDIAPHRAVYKMKLSSVKNGSNVSDVSGRMAFEWRDVCDGWAIQQHMKMRFSYSDGGDQDIESTELTWEAKDGKTYNFNIRRTADGQEIERYRGKAIQKPDGAVAVSYTVPQDKKLDLPSGTLFPTAHTKLVLHEAANGEKFFSRRIFDGSDAEGSVDISAFILPKRDAGKPFNARIKNSPLLADSPWPVHMAFYEAGSETGEPNYEMDISLLPNGVAPQIKIYYSDFSVVGNLDEVEPLKGQSCP